MCEYQTQQHLSRINKRMILIVIFFVYTKFKLKDHINNHHRKLIRIIIKIKMKNILFIGGSGQLGKKMTEIFKGSYSISNIDYSQNNNASFNFLLDKNLNAIENNKKVIEKFKELGNLYKAIIVTAGGWTGGNIKDNDYFTKTQQMMNVCLYPSLLGAHLATKYLDHEGLIILTGAAAVFKEPQPEMIGYSLAKTAVHSLALNLSQQTKQSGHRVITLLPETIDTESNRQAMPDADFSQWSKPEQIGQLVKGWVDGLNVPNNGSFALLKVKKGSVVPDFV